ncbi:YbaK/EbsC family protein [Patescibacteria group bacterium]|nr:YbaK/EbsC family protein [Patescibacteria group bacterium]
MPIPKKIQKFLDHAEIKYDSMEHKVVYTAFDKAQTLKVHQKIVGKTLAVKFDNRYAIILIPANKNLDKGKFKKTVNDWLKKQNIKTAKSIDFVKEVWMKKNLKGARVGAIPPFGTLWKLPTFIDLSLINQQKIIINSGSCNWSIRINPTYFKKILTDLVTGKFSIKKK